MRKLITFLLVAATVALSLLTAIMMYNIPHSGGFGRSRARLGALRRNALSDKKRKSLSSRGQNFVRRMAVSHRRVHHFPMRRI